MNVERLFDLGGRIAVVTGGAGHLGRALGTALAAAGAEVYVAGTRLERCREAAAALPGPRQSPEHGIVLDIRSMESVSAALDAVAARSGRLDILVNNAAFYAGLKLEEMTDREWQDGIDGTANGVFRCTRAAIGHMRERGGSIVNIASMYGTVSPDPAMYGDSGLGNPPNYGAGKAAILQFTRYTACHLARHGIRVNAISPGPFPNPKVQEQAWFVERLSKRNPLGRIGRPEDLAGAVVYLASDASAYVTGTNLAVDGGWTTW